MIKNRKTVGEQHCVPFQDFEHLSFGALKACDCEYAYAFKDETGIHPYKKQEDAAMAYHRALQVWYKEMMRQQVEEIEEEETPW